MHPKLDDKTLRMLADAEICSQRTGRRLVLATLGIGAGVAAILVVGLGGSANARTAAGDNPPPGLLAKIQIATQAIHRTPTFSAGRTMPRNTFRPRLRARR